MLRKIRECLEDSYFEVRDYSGRGMFGERCLGIVCDNVADVIIEIAYNAVNIFSTEDVQKILEELKNSRTDSMGRSMIIYWPYIKWEEDE